MEPSSSEEDRNYAQLEAVFRAHFADLYRYVYRQVHQAVIAEDLTSLVFLKALRWLQPDRSPESVKGWLYATARSVIADYWRERAQVNLLPLETAEEMPALSPESNDEQLQLLQTSIQRLLDGLPPRERDVLTLRYFQGYSAAEIGQELGLSAKYVRVLQLRALRHAASLETTERIVSMESPAIPYNQQALRALELTREEARALNHNYIGTEHLLLGIFDEGSAATELSNHGITAERIRRAILYILGRLPAERLGYTQETDYTPRTQAILVLAAEEARRMGETAINPHHLLVALLREGEGIAAGVLQASGVRLEQVGAAVRLLISPDEEGGPVTIPADLQEAFQQHPDAYNMFVMLSNANQKKIVDTIEQIEGEDKRKWVIERLMVGPFDRFTTRAHHVLTLAQEEAQRFQHNAIGTEHLLLGLVREEEGVAFQVLRNLGIEVDQVRQSIEALIGQGQRIVGEVGLTPQSKKVIEFAVDEARHLMHQSIGTEHFLLGLLREGNGMAAGVLENFGLHLEQVRTETLRVLAENTELKNHQETRSLKRKGGSGSLEASPGDG